MEVFLLDTRWFARTEGEGLSWTLLGKQQWAWLERSLKASDAPFKVLACGMVFNGSVRHGKHDCWGVYASEYVRLRTLIDGMPGRRAGIGRRALVARTGTRCNRRLAAGGVRHQPGPRTSHRYSEP